MLPEHEDELYDDGAGELLHFHHHDDRPATEAEAHVEWHLNSGVPMGQPCPWDACDPEPDPEPRGLGFLEDPGVPQWIELEGIYNLPSLIAESDLLF